MNDEGLSGRNLDKTVAEAFGFKPRITWEILNADETGTMIGFEREAAARKWWDEHPYARRDHHIGTWEHYEPYSESIEAAWRVVEALQKRGNMVSVNASDQGGYWCCVYPPQGQFIETRTVLSAAEAICLAALKAVDSQAGESSNDLKRVSNRRSA